jgi:phytanoyl-CoA hydroxylase
MLTSRQIADYSDQGYLIVPGLIDEADLARYEARFLSLASGVAPPVGDMKIMRDIMVVKGAVAPETPLHAINKMINFEDDPALYGYTTEPRLVEAVRDLLASDSTSEITRDIYSISTNVFNKPPGVDGRHPLHQDLRYFRIRPADKIIGTWTAFGRTDRESGCLTVIPGSHRGPLLDHDYPDWEWVNAGFYGVDRESTEGRERVYVEMAPGDTLLFHPLLIHGSGQNRSDRFRRAISSHYASAACESPVRDWKVGKSVRRIS